jgi:hypothetical protein
MEGRASGAEQESEPEWTALVVDDALEARSLLQERLVPWAASLRRRTRSPL